MKIYMKYKEKVYANICWKKTRVVKKLFMTRKMWKTLYEYFKRMNMELCGFYENIRSETAISDF